MIVGGYTLDLYCENNDRDSDHKSIGGSDYYGKDYQTMKSYQHQFVGETFSDCVRQARKKGWVVNTQKRTAYCPFCSKKATP